jgi:hypothetical protein
MLRIEPAIPILRIDPALPMLSMLPALPMLRMEPALRMLPTLRKLRMLREPPTLSRPVRWDGRLRCGLRNALACFFPNTPPVDDATSWQFTIVL